MGKLQSSPSIACSTDESSDALEGMYSALEPTEAGDAPELTALTALADDVGASRADLATLGVAAARGANALSLGHAAEYESALELANEAAAPVDQHLDQVAWALFAAEQAGWACEEAYATAAGAYEAVAGDYDARAANLESATSVEAWVFGSIEPLGLAVPAVVEERRGRELPLLQATEQVLEAKLLGASDAGAKSLLPSDLADGDEAALAYVDAQLATSAGARSLVASLFGPGTLAGEPEACDGADDLGARADLSREAAPYVLAIHRAAELAHDALAEGRPDAYREALTLAVTAGTTVEAEVSLWDAAREASAANGCGPASADANLELVDFEQRLDEAVEEFEVSSSVPGHLWGSTALQGGSVADIAARRTERELVLLGKVGRLLDAASYGAPEVQAVQAILAAEDAEGQAYLRRQLSARAPEALLTALAREDVRDLLADTDTPETDAMLEWRDDLAAWTAVQQDRVLGNLAALAEGLARFGDATDWEQAAFDETRDLWVATGKVVLSLGVNAFLGPVASLFLAAASAAVDEVLSAQDAATMRERWGNTAGSLRDAVDKLPSATGLLDALVAFEHELTLDAVAFAGDPRALDSLLPKRDLVPPLEADTVATHVARSWVASNCVMAEVNTLPDPMAPSTWMDTEQRAVPTAGASPGYRGLAQLAGDDFMTRTGAFEGQALDWDADFGAHFDMQPEYLESLYGQPEVERSPATRELGTFLERAREARAEARRRVLDNIDVAGEVALEVFALAGYNCHLLARLDAGDPSAWTKAARTTSATTGDIGLAATGSELVKDHALDATGSVAKAIGTYATPVDNVMAVVGFLADVAKLPAEVAAKNDEQEAGQDLLSALVLGARSEGLANARATLGGLDEQVAALESIGLRAALAGQVLQYDVLAASLPSVPTVDAGALRGELLKSVVRGALVLDDEELVLREGAEPGFQAVYDAMPHNTPGRPTLHAQLGALADSAGLALGDWPESSSGVLRVPATIVNPIAFEDTIGDVPARRASLVLMVDTEIIGTHSEAATCSVYHQGKLLANLDLNAWRP